MLWQNAKCASVARQPVVLVSMHSIRVPPQVPPRQHMDVSQAPATSNSCLTVLFNTAALGAMGLGVCNCRTSIGIVSERFSSVVLWRAILR